MTKRTNPVEISVVVPEHVADALYHLASHVPHLERGGASSLLAELASRVNDGVRRSGSWERAWLRSALPLGALEEQEQRDPASPWRSVVPGRSYSEKS